MALSGDVRKAVQRQVRKQRQCAKSFTRMTLIKRISDADGLQVEFYFSDSNLPRDKFLRDKIEEDPEVL